MSDDDDSGDDDLLAGCVAAVPSDSASAPGAGDDLLERAMNEDTDDDDDLREIAEAMSPMKESIKNAITEEEQRDDHYNAGKARTGDSARPSFAKVALAAKEAEVLDVIQNDDSGSKICSRYCPNRKGCPAVLRLVFFAAMTMRRSAFSGERAPFMMESDGSIMMNDKGIPCLQPGCQKARGGFAFETLKSAYRKGEREFKFHVGGKQVCEGSVRFLMAFDRGQVWEKMKVRVVAGHSTAYDSKALGRSEGRKGRKRKHSEAQVGYETPGDNAYASGRLVGWLRHFAASCGDKLPDARGHRNTNVLVLPFRRWQRVHRLYDEACDRNGMQQYQARIFTNHEFHATTNSRLVVCGRWDTHILCACAQHNAATFTKAETKGPILLARSV